MKFGYFLMLGPVLASLLKIVGPANPLNNGYSTGSQIGGWVGSCVSVLFGLIIVLNTMGSDNENA